MTLSQAIRSVRYVIVVKHRRGNKSTKFRNESILTEAGG